MLGGMGVTEEHTGQSIRIPSIFVSFEAGEQLRQKITRAATKVGLSSLTAYISSPGASVLEYQPHDP